MTLTVAAALAAVASAAHAQAPQRPRIVALGDSLTSGHGIGADRAFPATLQQKLDRAGYAFTVVNAGISGDTTTRAVQRFSDALHGEVHVLILAVGVNDGLRGVPVADVRRNLSAMIEQAQSRRIAVLLCGMEALPVYGWAYTSEFHQLYVELARTYQVPLVPFMMLGILGNPALMLPDRVHPNADGARAIANHVWPYLDALLARRGYLRSAT